MGSLHTARDLFVIFVCLLAVYFSVIVGVKDLGGEGEFVFDQCDILIEIAFGQLGDAFAQGNFAVCAVVVDFIGDKAAVGENGDMLARGKDIGAHQEAGVVFQSEKVGEGGEHIQRAAGDIDRDRRFHGCTPNEQPRAVFVKLLVHLSARKLGEMIQPERIGIVVVGQDDERVIQCACFFQLSEHVLQCEFQFQIACDICLCLARIGESVGQRLVFVRHIVVAEGIGHVTAEGQKICVERLHLAVFIGREQERQRLLHHRKVGSGVCLHGFQPLIERNKRVAHIGVRFVSAVVACGVIVHGIGARVDACKPVAEAEGQIVVLRGGKAVVIIEGRPAFAEQ